MSAGVGNGPEAFQDDPQPTPSSAGQGKQRSVACGRSPRSLVVLAGVAGFALGGLLTGIVAQSRCQRRYRRLCRRWFAGDPDGLAGCLERADDVCGW